MPQKPATPSPPAAPAAKRRVATDWASLAASGSSGGGSSLQGVDGVHRIQPLNLARTMVTDRSQGQAAAFSDHPPRQPRPGQHPSPYPSDTQQEADHLSRLAQVLERAEQAKGGEEAALAWLRTPHPALAGDPPAAWLKTDAGLAQVLLLLQQA